MSQATFEPLGPRIRRARLRLGLTLDELAGRTGISKPYLSLIENGKVNNPPSDEKLLKLEQSLGFTNSELIGQAHLIRTPKDVRAMLSALLGGRREGEGVIREDETPEHARVINDENGAPTPHASRLTPSASPYLNLDTAYMSGMLQNLVERTSSNVEAIQMNAVPIVNRVSAGYPKDFSGLDYARGITDDVVGCPDVHDREAFAARVHGDSMTPKYAEGDIVIFSPAAQPRNGDDCFVRFEDGTTTFKRVFFENNDQGQPVIRLQPRNERYRPQTVPADQINGLYRAIYRYQRVDEK